MGDTISRGSLFPAQLTNELFNMARGKSSLAILSNSEPIPFNGKEVFTFDMDSEVNLVGENGVKSNGGATVEPVTMIPVKVEYGVRVSDEFRYGADEIRLQYLRTFAEGFAKKVARGLDIMAFHGINPRTGLTASVLTNKNFADLVDQTVTYDSSAPDANVEDAISLVTTNEHLVTGMAMSPTFRSALAKLKKGSTSNEPMFPTLGWGSEVTEINGLPVDSNSTVSYNNSGVEAVVGNFADYFKWGFAKEIPFEVIEYGDPDNSGKDLKAYNQVYLRGEAYIGWGIIAPDAFAMIADSTSA